MFMRVGLVGVWEQGVLLSVDKISIFSRKLGQSHTLIVHNLPCNHAFFFIYNVHIRAQNKGERLREFETVNCANPR